MPKTQVNCPRCRQPSLVEVEQLFDLNQDPLAKQKLLNGAVNYLQCAACGYQGSLAIPVIYHDSEKELLLTFFPAELNVPLNEQEKQIGPLINQVITNTPQEKRKAYMLQPKAMFTYQALIEKILEGDGITKEMLEAQQTRIDLLQRLLSSPEDKLEQLIEQEKELFDLNFFSILSRVIQSSAAQPEAKANQALAHVQQVLFEKTEVGKQLFQQAKDTESALKTLQEAGKDGLTREKLLEIVLNVTTDTQLTTYVSLARTAFDYQFFQLLSERIEKTTDSGKEHLVNIRQKLLDFCDQVDQRINEHVDGMKKLLDEILSSENIEAAIEKNLEKIDETFIHILDQELTASRKKGDLDRINKLEQIMIVIEKASEPPAEVKLLESLLQFTSESDLDEKILQAKEQITDQFIELLNTVVSQNDMAGKNEPIREKLRIVNRAVLKYSMKKNLTK